jgi:hypothetical protein
MTASNTSNAIDQVFAAYRGYGTTPDTTTLLALLAELQMLDEVLAVKANKLTGLAFPEYHALKALLNHAKCVGDARDVVRLRSLRGVPVKSDIDQACLVSRGDCHAAVQRVAAHNRIRAKRAVFTAFRQWGPVLDLNPAVFNCMVRVFELVRSLGLQGAGTAYQAFEETYARRAEQDLPHFVTGIVAAQKESEERRLLSLMTSLYLAEAPAS